MKETKKIRLIKKQEIPATRPATLENTQKTAIESVKSWINRRKTAEPQHPRQLFAALFVQP